MKADRFISIDGKEAVMVGFDKSLPVLDASNLFNVEKTLVGKVVEILDTIPALFTSEDNHRMFFYIGDQEGFVSNVFYLVVKDGASYNLIPLVFSGGDALPAVTQLDAGKLLTVSSSGVWEVISPKSELPKVGIADNDFILKVVSGKWSKAAPPISATESNIKSILGISVGGDSDKFLNQRGEFSGIEFEIDVLEEIGIDEINGNVQKYLSEKGTFEELTDIDEAIGIDRVNGDLSQVLSQKGEFVELPSGIGNNITWLRLARPYFENSLHLIIEHSSNIDFSDKIIILDTNIEESRSKVFVFNGEIFIDCPESGLGSAFDGMTVLVNLDGIVEGQSYLRYKWSGSHGDSDWYGTAFPSSGEAYVTNPSLINKNDLDNTSDIVRMILAFS